MTGSSAEAEQFEAVLEELRGLVLDFDMIGVGVVLVGGQVIALEARAAGGDGVIQVRTGTDIEVPRGYSMEPDLLFDVDDDVAPRADAIPEILRRRGFARVKTYRWRKETPRGDVLVDMFVKLELRPGERKDSFDIYAYVSMKGTLAVGGRPDGRGVHRAVMAES